MNNLSQVTNIDGKNSSPVLPKQIMNYLIDIDGTICEDIPNEEPERFQFAYEIPEAKDFVNNLYDKGHIITFFTSRLEEHRESTTEWLLSHGFKYQNILFEKPRGGNYCWIDNANIQAIQYNGDFKNLIESKLY